MTFSCVVAQAWNEGPWDVRSPSLRPVRQNSLKNFVGGIKASFWHHPSTAICLPSCRAPSSFARAAWLPCCNLDTQDHSCFHLVFKRTFKILTACAHFYRKMCCLWTRRRCPVLLRPSRLRGAQASPDARQEVPSRGRGRAWRRARHRTILSLSGAVLTPRTCQGRSDRQRQGGCGGAARSTLRS